MMVKANMPVRILNPVEPLELALPADPTAMHTMDTSEPQQLALWSGAVSEPISARFGHGDVDSSKQRRTPATTPSFRTSRTATATGTTRTTTTELPLSADSFAPMFSDTLGAPFQMVDLVQAWTDCRRHKRQSHSAQAFEAHAETNLCALRDDLLSGRYTPGRSICFVVTRPKVREVWAADFRDRIVHHLLYNRIAQRFIDGFVDGSSACIPGRGTLYAAKRLEHHIRSITQNWSRPAYYLKLDLSNFFVAIDKGMLFEQLAAKVTEPFWLDLTRRVLFHDPRNNVQLRGDHKLLALVPPHKSLFNAPADTGLPIGNLSSQFFANVYLNSLDQFCKHQVKATRYVRYVDDFILLHESAQWLNDAHDKIEAYLPERLGAHLNPKKTILQPVARGVDFVGHIIKPWRRTTRPRTVTSALSRLSAAPANEVFALANSYFGLLGQASHSHQDRTRVAKLMLQRGHAVLGDMTKTYRKGGTTHA